ncbi:MAG: DUF6512 family protein [Oscillospiraceae bacterium]|nr:DUF6512 family protein [Oscillospiraceae bacterium]
MKRESFRFWLIFVLALALGVGLHFLYERFPSPVTALFSPVRESLWEHLKILFYPLLLSGLILSARQGRTAWLCSLLFACAVMLTVSWLYHGVLGGRALLFDLLLYALSMLLGFLLPRLLWPLGDWPGVGAACAVLTALLAVLLVLFTFFPPDNILFADLSHGLPAFSPIPV